MLGNFLRFLAIAFGLTVLAIMPAINPREHDPAAANAIREYVSLLLPPGHYHGVDRYGGSCEVESTTDHSIRLTSGGYDFRVPRQDFTFVQDVESEGSNLRFSLKNGGLEWCGQYPSYPCWQEQRLHKTLWLGHDAPSGRPYITLVDQIADKAECYGLTRFL